MIGLVLALLVAPRHDLDLRRIEAVVQYEADTQALAQPVASPPLAHDWAAVAACESGGRWDLNTGNGYYGGVQFSLASWRSVGGSGLPSDATPGEQIARAETLLARSGWRQWPVCGRALAIR